MYDAAVFICVVPVIAFWKVGNVTVQNGHCKYRKKYIRLDVDISMINLHWCNGIIPNNSTLCCYEKEKHFPNMADWKRTVVKTSTRQRHSNFFLNVFKVDIEIPSSFQYCIILLVDLNKNSDTNQQTDYMPDALLITSCSSLFIFTFGRCVPQQGTSNLGV